MEWREEAKEMKRIASGKEMSDIRASIQEQEIRKLAERRRREKQEEKEAKAKVLAQIEADKAARRAEREAAKVRYTERVKEALRHRVLSTKL